jgi:predicted transcriptional regulator
MPRLSTEERIRQLEAKIAAIKDRAERQKVRANPAVRHMKAALKALDKSMSATDDQVLRKSLGEARSNVSACLGLSGVTVKSPRGGALAPRPRKSAGRTRATNTENGPALAQPDANDLLAFLKNNPGSNSEKITAAFDTDAATLRGTMRGLIDQGRVRTEGERRGTRYFVGA